MQSSTSSTTRTSSSTPSASPSPVSPSVTPSRTVGTASCTALRNCCSVGCLQRVAPADARRPRAAHLERLAVMDAIARVAVNHGASSRNIRFACTCSAWLALSCVNAPVVTFRWVQPTSSITKSVSPSPVSPSTSPSTSVRLRRIQQQPQLPAPACMCLNCLAAWTLPCGGAGQQQHDPVQDTEPYDVLWRRKLHSDEECEWRLLQ